jgi:hypothetical protein
MCAAREEQYVFSIAFRAYNNAKETDRIFPAAALSYCFLRSVVPFPHIVTSSKFQGLRKATPKRLKLISRLLLTQ